MPSKPPDAKTPAPVLVSKDGPPYAAVFLDEASHAKLIEWWVSVVGVPLHPHVHAHHMTIKFDPNEDEILQVNIGAPASMTVIGYAEDSVGQAVLVRPNVHCHNKYPHVTVATATGASAKYSNTLLENGATLVNGPMLYGSVDIRID